LGNWGLNSKLLAQRAKAFWYTEMRPGASAFGTIELILKKPSEIQFRDQFFSFGSGSSRLGDWGNCVIVVNENWKIIINKEIE
jgi:hypothetical protein